MTFARRLAAAAGISLVLTVLLMLLFNADAPQAPLEALEASSGEVPTASEPAIRPISLRSTPPN
ncbi:MAG: hypothetical protein AB7N29_00425 [Vicinamibacterales bacterium]